MQLQDLFQNLSYGELSNLAIGGEGSGDIPVTHQPKLLGLVNQSLTAIYGRFLLLEKELVLAAQDSISTYWLHQKYAQTSSESAEVKYILDSIFDPFLGDVIKMLTIYDEEGTRLALNDPGDCESLYTPSFDAVQIPEPVTGNSYFVMYQARHPVLVPDDLTQEIAIPAVLEPALQAHVAFKVFSAMSGQEHLAKAQSCLARYEMICSDVEQKDLVGTSQTITNEKFTNRGWV